MDYWEIGSLLASLSIQICVFWQLVVILKCKRSEGMSLLSWYWYPVALGYFVLFTITKDQNWTLIANYAVATLLHLSVAIAAHYYYKYPGSKS